MTKATEPNLPGMDNYSAIESAAAIVKGLLREGRVEKPLKPGTMILVDLSGSGLFKTFDAGSDTHQNATQRLLEEMQLAGLALPDQTSNVFVVLPLDETVVDGFVEYVRDPRAKALQVLRGNEPEQKNV